MEVGPTKIRHRRRAGIYEVVEFMKEEWMKGKKGKESRQQRKRGEEEVGGWNTGCVLSHFAQQERKEG